MSSTEAIEHRGTEAASGPSLQFATTQPALKEPAWVKSDEDPIELKPGFRELVLIHRSLEAVRTLALFGREDDLLTDTFQLIDVAPVEAV